MAKNLLQLGDGSQAIRDYRWDLDGITFAIEERVGQPAHCIGWVEEMASLYAWANRVQEQV